MAEAQISVESSIVDRATVKKMIVNGDFLMIAGDEKVLALLPLGNWIAGTIPYFMTEQGGRVDQSMLYVNRICGFSARETPRLTLYDAKSIERIAQEAPDNGFTILIMPANSDVHLAYAQNAPDYPNMYFSPIIGWISGVHLKEIQMRTPKIGFGPASGLLSEKQAVAMHVPLPETQVAHIKIINLFKRSNSEAIYFPNGGFVAKSCYIGGIEWNFSDYIKQHNIDTRLPMIADYSGVMVNVSIQEVLHKRVRLYAPVFPNVEYRIASPLKDYSSEFNSALPAADINKVALCYNCILNFLYSELEGKTTGSLTGPVTFGEIAYQLLNQTLAYLTLERA